jgi:hypothetical protein
MEEMLATSFFMDTTSGFPVGLLSEVFYRSTMAKLKPKGI